MNFTKSTRRLILVYSAMPSLSPQERVDVILTPEFYTLKREPLPIRYAYQAKKIAPSLFGGLLDEKETYAYLVSKYNEGWEFIAYAPQRIRTFLERKGIPVEKVGKLFFAQQSVSSLKQPVAIGAAALVNLNGIATVVPQAALEEGERLASEEILQKPKRGVSFGGGGRNTLLTMRQTLSLAAILVLFGAMWIYEGWRYGKNILQEQTKMATLLENYPALQSSYTRQSISKKYHQLDRAERKKREQIKTISTMLFKGVTLTTLEINDKGFQAEFATTNKSVARKLKQFAQKEHFKATESADGKTVHIGEGR